MLFQKAVFRPASRTIRAWPATLPGNVVVDAFSDYFRDIGYMVRPGNLRKWYARFQKADIFIVHWPDGAFPVRKPHKVVRRTRYAISLLERMKRKGTRIIWFAHDLEPHDLPEQLRPAWEDYAARFHDLADGWLTLSPSTQNEVLKRYPALAGKPHDFIWHPVYPEHPSAHRTRARAALGLTEDQTLFGHAGLLRPYKNLDRLVRVFRAAPLEGSRLLVAGRPRSGVDRDLTNAADGAENIRLEFARLSQDRYEAYLSAMDVFVAPYARFLHSGTLIHALCRGCVVVAPRSPYAEDLREAVGERFVLLYDGEPGTDTLAAAARQARTNGTGSPDLSGLMPSRNIPRLRRFMKRLDVGQRD